MQSPRGRRTFELRTAGPPSALTAAVRDAVGRVDPNLPMINITTQAEQIENRFRQERFFVAFFLVVLRFAAFLRFFAMFSITSFRFSFRVPASKNLRSTTKHILLWIAESRLYSARSHPLSRGCAHGGSRIA